MLETNTPTVTSPTSSPGRRWCCWRDDGPAGDIHPSAWKERFANFGLRSMAVARLVGNVCGSANRGTSAVPLGFRDAGGELERSLGFAVLRWAFRHAGHRH